MKEHTTFIQFGKSRLIPIPFWVWLVIVRTKKTYWSVRIWMLRRLGIVYDFERGLTKRAADVCHESPSKTHSWYGSSQGYVCEHCGTRR